MIHIRIVFVPRHMSLPENLRETKVMLIIVFASSISKIADRRISVSVSWSPRSITAARN